jgi:hypothetical protein
MEKEKIYWRGLPVYPPTVCRVFRNNTVRTSPGARSVLLVYDLICCCRRIFYCSYFILILYCVCINVFFASIITIRTVDRRNFKRNLGYYKVNKNNQTTTEERREENQLDATECFIALIICSTYFWHLYAHQQELVQFPSSRTHSLLPCT